MLGLKITTQRLLLCSCLILTSFGVTLGHEIGSGVLKVVVKEGSDAILPCSLSTKENIVEKLFDWKKDGQKEVFLYDDGRHYNNGHGAQDEQFEGRVSHFPDQLKFGNASIIIRNTKVTDSGNYTCNFPRLQPKAKMFYINLTVDLLFRDRSGEISGAAPEPYTKILNATKEEALLQCEVRGAFPKPTVEWKDSDGKVLPAEATQVKYIGDHCYITLLATATKTTTNRFHCVVTQKDIGHKTAAEIFVPLYEKLCESGDVVPAWIGGWFLGVLTVAVAEAVALFVGRKYITIGWKKNSHQQGNCRATENELLTS